MSNYQSFPLCLALFALFFFPLGLLRLIVTDMLAFFSVPFAPSLISFGLITFIFIFPLHRPDDCVPLYCTLTVTLESTTCFLNLSRSDINEYSFFPGQCKDLRTFYLSCLHFRAIFTLNFISIYLYFKFYSTLLIY